MSDEETQKEEVQTEDEEMSEEMAAMMAAMMGASKEPRIVGLYGDIDEDKAANACGMMISLSKLNSDPIELYVSTNGGSADEMYALVDLMMHLKKSGVEIESVGLGKVMSAGVMILAAGTKGKRRAGKHTRFMLHSLQAASQGSLPGMKTDIKNFSEMQEKYIQALSEMINLSYKDLKKIVNKNIDTYFGAEKAIEMGIIDEIL